VLVINTDKSQSDEQYALSGTTDFKITLINAKYSVYTKVWPFVTTLGGSLLTIPGFLAYLKERRKQRSEDTRITIATDLPKIR
jgi:hypothetical protein